MDGSGAKARLVVVPEVLAVWRGLNATEQYFTLLEAWLLHGTTEMVGEHRGTWGRFLTDCIIAFREMSMNNHHPHPAFGGRLFLMGIGQNVFHLALMDLFGLVEVKQPRTPVAPWSPDHIAPTPFGEALFARFGKDILFNLADIMEEEEEASSGGFGDLQPLFGPYFPEWRNNLVLPEPEPQQGTYIFKVSLGKVWSLIAISSESTLEALVPAILDSVNFDNDHLYEFTYRDRFGATVTATHPEMDEGVATDEVQIGELPLRPGETMTFHFDFGDDWMFTVKLERIDPPSKKMKLPKILESHGKAPEQYPHEDDDDEDWDNED